MFNHRAGVRNGNPDALCRKNIVADRIEYQLSHDLEDVDDVLPLEKVLDKGHEKARKVLDPGIVNTEEVINKVDDPVYMLDTSH
ncbi:hypothetical protein DPMN_074603 [Dreissena polymorpha]|uniref:Uncharacterized protein n=1 Tax=Dreissena polymorpha TaxID=45954 RepID=A0A9D3YK60_DREPO|nr:hypothetical protein DPMN_074603 [Dreissena polymorpha]